MYYRIQLEWNRSQRKLGLPNAIDVQLGYGDPSSNPAAINQYILANYRATPSWSFKPITKAQFDDENVWVEADGSSGEVV